MEEHNSNYDPANRGSSPPPRSGQRPSGQAPPNQQYSQPTPPPYNQQPDQQLNQHYGRPGYQPYQNPRKKTGSSYTGAAIASLIAGILSILCFWHIFIAGFFAVGGIITAIVCMSQRKEQRGLAIAGLVTSIAGILISIIFLSVIMTFIGRTSSYSRRHYNDYYDHYYDDYYDDYYYDDYYDDYYYDDYYNDDKL